MGSLHVSPRSDACLTIPRDPRKIVLCGSMTFYSEMLQVQNHLENAGIAAWLPDPEDNRVTFLGPDDYDLFKRRASLAHLRRVRHRISFGVLVINLDKRGVRDYIGPSTFAEIAMARAFSKRVYLLGNYPAVYSDELTAWGVMALNGRLDRMLEDYWSTCLPEAQMKLFAQG